MSKELIAKLKKMAKHKNHEITVNENGTLKIALKCPEATLTQQQYKDDQDINNIMKKYRLTGIANLMKQDPMFDDVSNFDYQEAMYKIAEANSNFEQLDVKIKDKFNNDPAKLIEFLNDSKNKEEAIKLGLVKPDEVIPEQEPVKVVIQEPKMDSKDGSN